MDFSGHLCYVICDGWLFDVTTFIGYKIKQEDEKITDAIKAFKIIDKNGDLNLKYTRYIDNIPLAVFRKSREVIKKYYKEALICD